MIKLEEISEQDLFAITTNSECKLADHLHWLRNFFLTARANSTGDKYDRICKLQDELDQLFIDRYGE